MNPRPQKQRPGGDRPRKDRADKDRPASRPAGQGRPYKPRKKSSWMDQGQEASGEAPRGRPAKDRSSRPHSGPPRGKNPRGKDQRGKDRSRSVGPEHSEPRTARPRDEVAALRLGGIVTQRKLDAEQTAVDVQLRAMTYHPHVFKKMVRVPEPAPEPGDLVRVLDKRGAPFGYGYYNPRSTIAVRMVGDAGRWPDEEFWRERLQAALALRARLPGLGADTDACRLIHSEADGFPGLVVDLFGEVLSIELFSLAMAQRLTPILDMLFEQTRARHFRLDTDQSVQTLEGFRLSPMQSSALPEEIVIQENGLPFLVRFEGSHKTGFFCDQRDNRRRLSQWCDGQTVLDLCCYSGGFSMYAAGPGNARSVTAVDLDEKALKMARKNASLQEAKVQFRHADAFDVLRGLIEAKQRFDVVVLDPPKLIRNRTELATGRRKYFDLNRMAYQVVKPGGLLLTCSCSGLMGREEFAKLVHAASWQAAEGETAGSESRRNIQVLAQTGAAADHPVAPDCPETEYLKAMWVRVN